MKVYCVFDPGFHGEYLLSVWSTKKKAEAEVKRCQRGRECQFFVEEVTVDKHDKFVE